MKVSRSKYDIAVEAACLIILIGSCIYLAAAWGKAPARVPVHYNLAGEVDRMGSKSSVFLLLITNWGLYILVTVLEQFPRIWNTGVTVTERNKRKVYRALKSMLGTEKLVCVLLFGYMTIMSLQGRRLPGAFTLVTLGAIFGTTIFFLFRLARVSKE